jgi:hypothetical protein
VANGVVHGKKMLGEGIRFRVSGKEIVKAIEERIEKLRKDMRDIRVKRVAIREPENFITVTVPKSPLAFDFYSPNL